MRYSVKVNDSGMRDWLNTLHGNDIEDAIDGAVEEVANDAANEMSGLAPVDTGHLRGSLAAARSVVQKDVGEWLIRNRTEYTIRQNFEHKTQGGFVTKPYEKANAKLSEELVKAVKRVLE